ncbi:2-hydroxyacid dehydrogenase [Gimesia maris]|uniref:2-hydroxyacid dehydrogenase n=1 Tax=Gimesia maris TaxID=122 RepID=UPI0030DCD0E4|tara:strand:- start:3547 stop:4683 length:1137 start_codon:yes stop_codon:yes gene_type:complete
MNDGERLQAFIEQLQGQTGLNAARYERMLAELNATQPRDGHDTEGRRQIAFFDAKQYDLHSFSARNDDSFQLIAIESPLNEQTVSAAAGCKVVCIFVNDEAHERVIARLAELGVELIALRCAGFNHVDLEACQKYGMSVVRVPAYSPHAVAEHTVALMLMLNRHLHQAYLRNRAGAFVLDGLTGFDMYGKTVGVIGTGKIGQCVVQILNGFGCRVLAYDVQENPEVASLPQTEYVGLDALFAQSDIVTLHLPLFEETHHLINSQTIARMKRGVMLINTSRGGLVETVSLIEGLKSGQIGYAGLDVYEEEAGIFFHDISNQVLDDDVLARLMTFNNVVITSHQAFLTREALDNIAETTFANIAEYFAGKRGTELTHHVG